MTDGLLVVDCVVRRAGFALQAAFQAGMENVAVVGPSGAGKTTLLRAVAGLLRPEAGIIRLNGRVLFDARRGVHLPPQARRVGYVPQQYALFPHLTVWENVAYGLHRLPRAERAARVRDLLALMRLEDLADRKPAALSGGQQQRVALARALAPQPAILLMDEPLAALDRTLRRALAAELRTLSRRFGIPLLFVTHDIQEAYSLADRLVILDGGRVVQAADRETVFRQPATPAVARALGMSNLIPLTAEGGVWHWHGIPLPLTAPPRRDRALAGFRPEDVLILKQDRPQRPRPGEVVLTARLVRDEHRGTEHVLGLAVRFPDGTLETLEAVIPHPLFRRLRLVPDAERTIAIRCESLHIFEETSRREEPCA